MSILFEYEHTIEYVEVKKAIGLNYSANGLYVDSEGERVQYNAYYQRSFEKMKKMSCSLSKMQKESKNWLKQQQKITLLHEKTANRRRDFLHKQSRKIANAYDLVGVEDFSLIAVPKNLNFGKPVADKSWGMFRTFLKYKLEEQGKYFIKVNKRFWQDGDCEINVAVSIRDEAVAAAYKSNANRGAHGDSSLILASRKRLEREVPVFNYSKTVEVGTSHVFVKPI